MMKYVSETARRASQSPHVTVDLDVKVGDANALVGFGAGTVKAVCADICRPSCLHLLCLPLLNLKNLFDGHAPGRGRCST